MDTHDSNYDSSRHEFERREPTMRRSNWPVYLLTVALVIAVAGGYMYASGERQQRRDLAAANQSLASSLAQVQSQLQSVNERMSDLLTRTAPPPAPVPARVHGWTRVQTPAKVRVVPNDRGLGNIQSQLSEQRKQIASARQEINRTQSDLSQTRDDLQSNINTTKDELNGSIARTHDEVVLLQKRGERNYYEFALDKSKQYSRVGPLSVELRKADTKHKRFDMLMLVDDNELQKKSVNLYETVWISLSDRPQPMELVVNKITKDHIEGYLSEPKYKKSELQSSVAAKPSGPTLQQ
jgi:septal ring factor EnvC (AmiA/AmiB activator)